MKVLVTGGAGFIGPHIVDRLIKRGDFVRVFDNLSTGDLSNIARYISTGAVELVRGDVRDLAAVKGAAEGCELIYHLAAQSSVPKSTEDPQADMEINVGGTHNVLMAAKEQGAKVVFASSSVVYGRSVKVPTPEAHRCPSRSTASRRTENYCRTTTALRGADGDTEALQHLRTGNQQGSDDRPYRKLMRIRSASELLGSGTRRRIIFTSTTRLTFIMAARGRVQRGGAQHGLGESYTVLRWQR